LLSVTTVYVGVYDFRDSQILMGWWWWWFVVTDPRQNP